MTRTRVKLFLAFSVLAITFFGYQVFMKDPGPSLPSFEFKKINETILTNGTWIQEVYIENGVLYSVACIRDKPPRLYVHNGVTNRTFLKLLGDAPDGYLFHKGLAITRAHGKTYAFVNIHSESRTLTACYIGESIESLEYDSIVSYAGYFENTTVNFRIREVWFNETDNLFYAYFDGSSVWKGTHLHTYLGKSADQYFDKDEFKYLYSGGVGWNRGGLYAPNVLWLDGYAIGTLKGYRNLYKPYDFDSDLVYIEQPKNVIFYTDIKEDVAFFGKYLFDEAQASFFFEYENQIYLASRHGASPGKVIGTIFEVRLTK